VRSVVQVRVGIPRGAMMLAGSILALSGCAGTEDAAPAGPVDTVTARAGTVTASAGTVTAPAPSPPGPTAGERTDTVAPPSPQDVELEAFASPSGVVCDLDVMDEYDAPRYPGARWAKCWVPDAEYQAYFLDEEQVPISVTCEEDLVMVWPYNSEMWTECEPHQPFDVPVLAEGGTSRSSGFECTIGADIIECLTDDGSGFGFRIGNSLFEGLGQ
jgi:hypothetical protein